MLLYIQSPFFVYICNNYNLILVILISFSIMPVKPPEGSVQLSHDSHWPSDFFNLICETQATWRQALGWQSSETAPVMQRYYLLSYCQHCIVSASYCYIKKAIIRIGIIPNSQVCTLFAFIHISRISEPNGPFIVAPAEGQ